MFRFSFLEEVVFEKHLEGVTGRLRAAERIVGSESGAYRCTEWGEISISGIFRGTRNGSR